MRFGEFLLLCEVNWIELSCCDILGCRLAITAVNVHHSVEVDKKRGEQGCEGRGAYYLPAEDIIVRVVVSYHGFKGGTKRLAGVKCCSLVSLRGEVLFGCLQELRFAAAFYRVAGSSTKWVNTFD